MPHTQEKTVPEEAQTLDLLDKYFKYSHKYVQRTNGSISTELKERMRTVPHKIMNFIKNMGIIKRNLKNKKLYNIIKIGTLELKGTITERKYLL